MLSREHRLISGADFRRVSRTGRRGATDTLVASVVRRADAATRFGFIVAKTVGNAPTRNRVRRRLRAAAYGMLPSLPPGVEVVVRALPGSAEAGWTTLQADLDRAVRKGLSR